MRDFTRLPCTNAELLHAQELGIALLTCTGLDYDSRLLSVDSTFTTDQCCKAIGKHETHEISPVVYFPFKQLGFDNIPGIPVKLYATDEKTSVDYTG